MSICLSSSVFAGVSIAVKRNYDHGNVYDRKHLIGGWFTIQRFRPLSVMWGTLWYAGRHAAEEKARVLYPDLTGSMKNK